MRIKEIELDNFKSFGRRTVIPLLNGFTTISGPNGSGKSNIVDSLLFALGLSSTRSMRAERLPDLLNNLSGKNEASVIVRFTNDSGVDLEVSRRIRVKDNGYTSTYGMNGKVTTLSEIHDELMKYNVSTTGFNVIMQGDVTGIVSMSAGERRKIIDELAGVADFDRRIDQAQQELKTVGEKIEHQKLVLVEIKDRLEVLRGDRDVALKYLNLKSEKEKVERDLIFVRVKETEDRQEFESRELERIKELNEKLIAQLESSEIELLQLRSEMGRLDQEIRERGGNEQLLLRQELENQRGELTREENKLTNLTAVIGEKAKLDKSLQSQIKVIDKHLRELASQKTQAESDLEAIKLGLAEKQGALAAVQAHIDVLRNEKDRVQDRAGLMHEELRSMRDQRHGLEVRKAELSTRREGLERELSAMRAAATVLIGKSAGSKSHFSTLESKLKDEQAQTLGIERNIRQLEDELRSTKEEIESKRQELDSIKQRLIQLETTRNVAGETGYGRAVEAVVASDRQGVYGTIGQLATVPSQYETALEVAIGPRLAHVVVEDDSVAQECIELLKREQVGRATFVPLSKISTQMPGLLPNKPGVIDFAYNLIDFDPKLSRAFQYACGQTIVVESMEVGRRLLTQARMVTLQGELFEKSGSMSGGYDTRQKLRFSGKDKSDLGALSHKSKALVDDIQRLNGSVKELEAYLNQERERMQEAGAKLARQQAEFEVKRQESDGLDKEIEDLKPRLRSAGDEVERIAEELAQIEDAWSVVDREINQRQDELTDITKSGTRTEVEKLIGECEDLESDIESIERNTREQERHIDQVETERRLEETNRHNLVTQLEAVSQDMAQLTGEKPEHEARVGDIKAAIGELQRKISQLSDELSKLQDSKDALHERITQFEVEKTKVDQDRIHLSEEKEKHQLLLAELLEELARLKEELAEILRDQPDYQPPSAGTIRDLMSQAEKLDKRMRAMEPVNMKALTEFNQTEERERDLTYHLCELDGEKKEILERISGYDELKKKTFMESFEAINHNFQEIFAELSHGHGRLELEEPDNPFNGGLIIRAQPRDKKMQRIEALSGGEKSLTALSFVFAFQRYAPAPFYAFDEVDMMLDGSNAERLARMVRRHSESAQFVVVSLRRPMIENADHAVGVSLKADGYSKVVGIKEIHIPDEQAQPA